MIGRLSDWLNKQQKAGFEKNLSFFSALASKLNMGLINNGDLFRYVFRP